MPSGFLVAALSFTTYIKPKEWKPFRTPYDMGLLLFNLSLCLSLVRFWLEMPEESGQQLWEDGTNRSQMGCTYNQQCLDDSKNSRTHTSPQILPSHYFVGYRLYTHSKLCNHPVIGKNLGGSWSLLPSVWLLNSSHLWISCLWNRLLELTHSQFPVPPGHKKDWDF